MLSLEFKLFAMQPHNLLLCLLMFPAFLFAQTKEKQQHIKQLEDLIGTSQKKEKLKWMDSLASITYKEKDYLYYNLVKETITLASELDSSRVVAKHIANYIYRKTNLDGVPGEGITIYNKYVPKLKKITHKKWLASVYIEHGFSHFLSGNIDSSFYYFDKTLSYARALKDEYLIADVKVCIGEAKAKQGDFLQASQNLQEAAIAFRTLKDTSKLLHVKKNIILLYTQSGFFEEAQKEIEEAIPLAKEIREYRRVGVFLLFAANLYHKKGLEKKRIKSLKETIKYSDKSKYDLFNRFRFLSATSIAYSQNDSIVKAKEFLKKIEKEQKIISKAINLRNRIYYVDALKYIAKVEGNLIKARDLGEESFTINKERRAYEEMQDAAFFLSEVYDALGRPNKSLERFKIYSKIKDSITGIHKTRTLAFYQTLYETEKRDQQIKAQNANIIVLEQKNKIRNQWFLIVGILTGLLFVIFYVRNRYIQKMKKRVAIEQLRTKISADLHDDVGSVLTGLAMQSELIERQVPEKNKEQLRKISLLSRAAMLQMRDAVWAMDASKDNWASLIDRIKEFAGESLLAKNINYTLHLDDIQLTEELTGAIRQNLYLITKEAIANILKHSNASEVHITLAKSHKSIKLNINDDGVILTNTSSPSGLGLNNMRRRASQLGGTIDFKQDNGFKILVHIPYAV